MKIINLGNEIKKFNAIFACQNHYPFKSLNIVNSRKLSQIMIINKNDCDILKQLLCKQQFSLKLFDTYVFAL